MLDLVAVAVAGGFVPRAVAGGFVAGVPLRQPFLLVALCASLALVAGKRRSEQPASGGALVHDRPMQVAVGGSMITAGPTVDPG